MCLWNHVAPTKKYGSAETVSASWDVVFETRHNSAGQPEALHHCLFYQVLCACIALFLHCAYLHVHCMYMLFSEVGYITLPASSVCSNDGSLSFRHESLFSCFPSDTHGIGCMCGIKYSEGDFNSISVDKQCMRSKFYCHGCYISTAALIRRVAAYYI